MKEQEEFKDDFISDIIKNGSRTLPNDNFENQMLLKLASKSNYKKEVSRMLVLSMRLFVVGLILGSMLIVSLLFGESIFQFNNKTLVVIALFAIVVIGILNIENYKRIINKYSM